MCLFTFQEKELIAQDDIECWKVIQYKTNIFGKKIAVTPIRERFIPKRILSGKSYFRSRGFKDVTCLNKRTGNTIIRGGFIHVFSTIENAQKFILPSPYCFQIRKCVIPKGTKYYTSDDYAEYAARKIKFL